TRRICPVSCCRCCRRDRTSGRPWRRAPPCAPSRAGPTWLRPRPRLRDHAPLESAAVSKAAKRERQKENRERAREERERLMRRQRQMKTLRSLAIVLVPIMVILIIVSVTSGSDESASFDPKLYYTTTV